MDNPTDEFMDSMIGKRVAISTSNNLVLHGTLLYVEKNGVVLGMGPVKNPRPIIKEWITKMYPLHDDANDGQRPGMVKKGTVRA